MKSFLLWVWKGETMVARLTFASVAIFIGCLLPFIFA